MYNHINSLSHKVLTLTLTFGLHCKNKGVVVTPNLGVKVLYEYDTPSFV